MNIMFGIVTLLFGLWLLWNGTTYDNPKDGGAEGVRMLLTGLGVCAVIMGAAAFFI